MHRCSTANDNISELDNKMPVNIRNSYGNR